MNNSANESRVDAIIWLKNTVYKDKRRGEDIPREVFLSLESDRVFFHADALDFDKDDKAVNLHYLDTFDGWKDEYLPHIKWYIL